MGRKICGVEFAPLNVPLVRRLQTLAAFIVTFIFFFGGATTALLFIYFLWTRYFWITFLYLGWLWYDWRTPSRGGRRVHWLRKTRLIDYFRDYFPLSFVKTADLDPSQRYIFGYHPHGMIGCGAVNFYEDVTGFQKAFPGIDAHVMILKVLLMLPFGREFMMGLGCCDVSKESIDYIFRKPGTAVVILIGGAKEALDSKPHTTSLVLKNRKGFVKMALKHGAHLVPCFGFGENELYRHVFDNRPGTTARKVQGFCQKYLTFTPICFTGRGMFNYTFGTIPQRRPVVTVIGRPIPVEQDAEPSQATIDKLHKRYMVELEELFDAHKAQYGYENRTIQFAE